ncbi:MAG: N-acetyltransferase [Rhodobacterales bacterium CG15_BIG_FIL_POST_REV_8_21_14_020_59_13]|nr:MAG: N-acetyltransferase [Rhodobacterales bacterium CG15_BIG_FIL_POST_REV_8_21_14_020_59_13]
MRDALANRECFAAPFGVIETERLDLRPLELGDAPWLARESSRPEIARMTGRIPSPNPPLFVESFILTMRAAEQCRGDHVRLIIDRRDGDRIGVVGLNPHGGGVWELGYWLSREKWGHGYATEASHGLLEYAKEHGITCFQAGYFLENPASGRVLEKLGFADTGRRSEVFSIGRMAASAHADMVLHMDA